MPLHLRISCIYLGSDISSQPSFKFSLELNLSLYLSVCNPFLLEEAFSGPRGFVLALVVCFHCF